MNTTPLNFPFLTESRLVLIKAINDKGQMTSAQMHISVLCTRKAIQILCTASYSDDTKVGRARPPYH